MKPLLKVEDLKVDFTVPGQGSWPWSAPRILSAVDGVSFCLKERESLGIVGESGSGKTTLARSIVGTVNPTFGKIYWKGKDLATVSQRSRYAIRGDMTMIFQNPLSALNPRMTVGRIIGEPLQTHHPSLSSSEVTHQVGTVMERVGLLPNLVNRYPHEFSGGQCQRVGIARALVLKPKLIICDEPVAALDVSVRAQVVNLLRELKNEFGLSLILITHDLSLVKHLADRALVMYFGRMAEVAPSDRLVCKPLHPYSRALISSVPIPDPVVERKRPRQLLEGEIPSPISPPPGCAFESRCPRALNRCASQPPRMREISTEHAVACHNPLDPSPDNEG